MGMRYRDTPNTGSVAKPLQNSAVAKYLFGKELDEKLSIEKFIHFQEDLQIEILKLEVQSAQILESNLKLRLCQKISELLQNNICLLFLYYITHK